MREALEKLKGKRKRFSGTFDRYSLKTSFRGLPKQTLLLRDVENPAGDIVTDHLWFNLTKGFDALGDLYPGDVVAFDARVTPYEKGHVNRDDDLREMDYKLSHPTKLRVIRRVPRGEELVGYYLLCSKCGHRNTAHRMVGDYPRCRRCGRWLKMQPPQEAILTPVFMQATLTIGIGKGKDGIEQV